MKSSFVIGRIISTALICTLLGCSKQYKIEQEVFFTDFESDLSVTTQNLQRNTYLTSTVAGFYNADTLTIELDNLPAHEFAIIEFDLYIHDTWDGNSQAGDGTDGPDIWRFSVDGNTYINSTFTNAYCPPGQHCQPQSYPSNYPNNSYFPRTGSAAKLPGVCGAAADPEATSLYKISKTIKHSSKTMRLTFEDELVQLNHVYPTCDESWSIDNLRVRVIGN